MVTTGGRGDSSSGCVGLLDAPPRRHTLLADGLEAELGGDELDLVEVEPLIDRHHHAQLLEGELDDLGRGNLHRLGELGHRDVFVDPDAGLFLLLFLRQPAGNLFPIGGSSARRAPFRPGGAPLMLCRVRRMFACTASWSTIERLPFLPFLRPPPFSASGPNWRAGGPPGTIGATAPGRRGRGPAAAEDRLGPGGIGPRRRRPDAPCGRGAGMRGGMNGARGAAGALSDGRRRRRLRHRGAGLFIRLRRCGGQVAEQGAGPFLERLGGAAARARGRSDARARGAASSAARSACCWASTWATSAAVRRRLLGAASAATGTGSGRDLGAAFRRPFLAAASSALLPLLPLPADPDRGDLIVLQRRQVAAHEDVHLLEQPSSCSGGTPNSAARSCTLVLTTQSSVMHARAPAARSRQPARGPVRPPPSPAGCPAARRSLPHPDPPPAAPASAGSQPDHLVHARAGSRLPRPPRSARSRPAIPSAPPPRRPRPAGPDSQAEQAQQPAHAAGEPPPRCPRPSARPETPCSCSVVSGVMPGIFAMSSRSRSSTSFSIL